jgi:hypothetical protein
MGLRAALALAMACGGCSADKSSDLDGTGSGNGPGAGSGGASSGQGGGIDITTSGAGGGGSPGISTCEDAASAKSYIGCDFWPTIGPNNVWSIFDFAVVVANASAENVEAQVTGGNLGAPMTASIPPNSLQTLYLPWVPELKGPDANECGNVSLVTQSIKKPGGAYHLTTNKPVTVYQFSALEYEGKGGPPGKSWSACPGLLPCITNLNMPIGCFSFSNDASLLLPTTALTSTYRVMGWRGWQQAGMGTYILVTGTADGTNVEAKMSGTGVIAAGGGIPGAAAGQSSKFTLDQGEVAVLVGDAQGDQSGSLVTADKPVQVVTGIPCVYIPDGAPACDHLEESVFPAETLGKHYFVTRPLGPNGDVVNHVVRLYGNVDGTQLSYPQGAPQGAPTVLNAGQTFDVGTIGGDFEIVGSAAFAVGMYMLGASIIDPGMGRGDPAQTFATAVEQYRTRYIFLAPEDYLVNFVAVIHPSDATLTLDGNGVSAPAQPIGGSGYSVSRVQLDAGKGGAHELVASKAVGIQVGGYGQYTTFYYPGGSDLLEIAPPPVK